MTEMNQDTKINRSCKDGGMLSCIKINYVHFITIDIWFHFTSKV